MKPTPFTIDLNALTDGDPDDRDNTEVILYSDFKKLEEKLNRAVTTLWVIGEDLCQQCDKSVIAREALSEIVPNYKFTHRKPSIADV